MQDVSGNVLGCYALAFRYGRLLEWKSATKRQDRENAILLTATNWTPVENWLGSPELKGLLLFLKLS